MTVFWIWLGESAVTYTADMYGEWVRKFLYFKDQEILIAGSDGQDHKGLYRTAKDQGIIQEGSDPDGAGDANRGVVYNWESNGFMIETPKELRPAIIEALGLKDSVLY